LSTSATRQFLFQSLHLQCDVVMTARGVSLQFLLQSDCPQCSLYDCRGMLDYIVYLLVWVCNSILPCVSASGEASVQVFVLYTAREA
jgi:hypothetical protein